MLKEREGGAHIEQGRRLVRHGDFAGALRENERVLALAPKSRPAGAALFGIGLIEADPANPGKDYGKALTTFRQVVTDFPDSDFARESSVWIPFLERELSPEHQGRLYLQRIGQLSRQGHFAEAQQEDENLLDSPSGPLADAALFSLGQLLADPANPQRDYRKALGFFTRLVAEFPQSPYANEGRVWCGILQEQFTAEREASAHLRRVQLLIRLNEFDKALREGEQLLAQYPKSQQGAAALFGMALVYADRSNPRLEYRRASGLLAQLEKDFPQSPLAEDARIWQGVLKNVLSAEREGQAHLQRMQALIRKGDFEGIQRENQKVLGSSAKGQPEDAALFSLGLLYVDQANPKKDYKKAASYFARLRREYPASQFAEEAKIWTGLLETMEKSLRVDLEIEQKKHELTR